MKKQQQQQGVGADSGASMGMGMGANRDALGEIEAKLRQAQQQQQREQSIDNDDVGNAEENRSMRHTRYGVEYRLKRPVENILKAYEKKPIYTCMPL